MTSLGSRVAMYIGTVENMRIYLLDIPKFYPLIVFVYRFMNPTHTVAVSKNDVVEDEIYIGHVESLGDDNIIIR